MPGATGADFGVSGLQQILTTKMIQSYLCFTPLKKKKGVTTIRFNHGMVVTKNHQRSSIEAEQVFKKFTLIL
jgi:hypothetical protein